MASYPSHALHVHMFMTCFLYLSHFFCLYEASMCTYNFLPSLGRHGCHNSDPLGSGNPFLRSLKYCRPDILYIRKRETATNQDDKLAEIVSYMWLQAWFTNKHMVNCLLGGESIVECICILLWKNSMQDNVHGSNFCWLVYDKCFTILKKDCLRPYCGLYFRSTWCRA